MKAKDKIISKDKIPLKHWDEIPADAKQAIDESIKGKIKTEDTFKIPKNRKDDMA
jgi:hypothetical protein